jgi:hypothetical protein
MRHTTIEHSEMRQEVLSKEIRHEAKHNETFSKDEWYLHQCPKIEN